MSDAREWAGKLGTILAEEERLYLELRELLQQERAQIIGRDATALERTVRQKETLADESKLLEESRRVVISGISDFLELDAGQPTLAMICQALGERAGDLPELHSRLVALVGAVKELLRANEGFAGEALARVNATLGLLGRLMPESPIYGPKGPPQSHSRLGRRSGRLLQQAI